MRTSLHEIERIERYLHDRMDPEEQLLFHAERMLNQELDLHTRLQARVYEVIRRYGRRKLSAEIAQVQEYMFRDPANASFRNRIISLFKQ